MIAFLQKWFNRHPKLDVFELDTTYPIIIDNYAFGRCSSDALSELFRDGRVASRFIELEVLERFSGLRGAESSNAKGYDMVGRGGQKLEVKTFTKGGCKFVPSYMVGSGRKMDVKKAKKETVAKYLCIADITDFPHVNLVFKLFADVWSEYPNGVITYKNKQKLFATEDELT
jgi:hypothetical protein